MDKKGPLFILAGICPYQNRGCEAIVRGTVKILRRYFKEPSFLSVSFIPNADFKQQCKNEYDTAIIHKRMNSDQYFGKKSLLQRIIFKCDKKKKKFLLCNEMLPFLDDAVAVLSIGGDNYSLDYGIPRAFTDLDDVVLDKKRPLILWGASVGPFDKFPEYEKYMVHHLRNVTAVFARESATVDYLRRKGITENVYRVADPAFLMDPMEPRDENKKIAIKQGAIGINLSPLMANYVTGGDLKRWEQIAADILGNISQKISRPLYLIPHVTVPDSNDFTFMENVRNTMDPRIKNNIRLIQPIYNATETKWIISNMALFAGARTHSTIAALSTNIPTLSFAYSIKAKGINRDIFGHEDFCLDPDKLTPENVTSHIESMLDTEDQIKTELKEKIPHIQENALNAGKYLKGLLEYS